MKYLFTAILFLFLSPLFGHKFYVSIADMEYDEADKKINVSLKMTAHDFEYILELKYGKKIHLEEYSDTSAVMDYSKLYLKQNFKLFSGGEQCPMIFVGHELTLRDELYFYFSFAPVKDPSAIKIVNKLLFSLSDQQQNIVHYRYKNVTKSVTLISSQSEDELLFEK
ncbi:MAG: DUF6702 family protein [Crocinitomicaceae bacterium]